MDEIQYQTMDAHMQAAAAAAKFRTGMHSKISALDARAMHADERAHAARAAASATQQHIDVAKDEVRTLHEANEQLKAALAAEAEWQRKDAHSGLVREPIGRVTPEVSHCWIEFLHKLRTYFSRLPCRVQCASQLRPIAFDWCAGSGTSINADVACRWKAKPKRRRLQSFRRRCGRWTPWQEKQRWTLLEMLLVVHQAASLQHV